MPVRAVVSDMRKMHVGSGSPFFISDLNFAESLFQTCSKMCLKIYSINLCTQRFMTIIFHRFLHNKKSNLVHKNRNLP